MVTELTLENFREIVDTHTIVVVDFWASWCGPCRAFAPIYETAAQENTDITFTKVNTEEQQELANHFNIRSIPTLMIFREQILIFSQAGSLPKTSLDELITQVKDLNMDEVRREIAAPEESDPPQAT